MAEIKSIVVNDKTYKVQMLSVVDTIDLHIELVSCMGAFLMNLFDRNNRDKDISKIIAGLDSEGVKKLKKKILPQIITPENKFLADDMEIEHWFGQPDNRGDIWPVLIKGAIELLGEYAPSFLKEGIQKVSEEQLQSQNSTEPKP